MSDPTILHASCVAVRERGVLILGASGRGKSALALELLALGGALVADDRTCLARRGADLLAWSPPAILGRIEARGIGILAADPAPPTRMALVVDLDRAEEARLPTARHWSHMGWSGPLILGADHPHLAVSVLQYLKGGRTDLEDA
ncbi:serine kinase [Palleronia sp. LCG004]|uniref:HPr kinase/phosphorylase n=1 Tax=Palleronia sp. LCG004 TaxID=3079304 RepID=UPI0029433FEF|nr:serine kinase [Palleronia sp. LCG004]WOI56657.1 serine kinase [Palleronia sp. LCG004]